MAPFLDLLRLFVGVSLLGFASYTDWQWRRAPNVLWLIMGGIGLALLATEAAIDWPGFAARWPYLAGAVALIAFVYALWYFGLIAGGADAKALMAIALLVPYPISLADSLPPLASPLPGGFTILSNSLLAFLVIPLGLLLWNLAHGDIRPPHLILGMKKRAADIRRGHQWPMEIIDDSGARKTKLFASRMTDQEIDETFARLQALGDERIWVSPKIPFMLPILAGFILAFVAGDLLVGAMTNLMPRP